MSSEAPGEIRIIDGDFAQLLVAVGKRMKARQNKWRLGGFAIGMLLGSIFFIPSMWWLAVPLSVIICIGCCYALMLSSEVSQSFRKQLYRRTAAKLHKALLWNAFFYPITYQSLHDCLFVQIKLLVAQGRCCEFEALTRIMWSVIEPNADKSGVPKNAMIAINLAASFLMQKRYKESLVILEHVAASAKAKEVRSLVVVNMILCYCFDDQLDRASKLIETSDVVFSNAYSKCRFKAAEAIVRLRLGSFEESEACLIEAQSIAEKSKESSEFLAFCYGIWAELRVKQQRLDEAELHYKNAIDLVNKNVGPSYLSLSELLKHYAAQLKMQNRSEESLAMLKRSDDYESAFWERERASIEKIGNRLMEKRLIFLTTEIVELFDMDYEPMSVLLSD